MLIGLFGCLWFMFWLFMVCVWCGLWMLFVANVGSWCWTWFSSGCLGASF